MSEPSFTWDPETNTGYLKIKPEIEDNGVVRTVHADARVLLDYDDQGRVIGVEVLSPFK